MHEPLLKEHFLRYVALTPRELEVICSYFQPFQVGKGEYVLRKGEICRFEGFVVQGCFQIFTINPKAKEKILYFAAEDWWVMDVDSFTHETPSELYIQAIEDSTMLSVSKPDKEVLYQELPKVERIFRIMSQKAVASWQRRLVRNHSISAEDRYHHFVTSYPGIAKRVTNKQIASYLGITQEFVSIIRKRRLTRNV
ncbi:MAG: Crp/Fnr family transcriptional regulator [Bacteroidota bacterium]